MKQKNLNTVLPISQKQHPRHPTHSSWSCHKLLTPIPGIFWTYWACIFHVYSKYSKKFNNVDIFVRLLTCRLSAQACSFLEWIKLYLPQSTAHILIFCVKHLRIFSPQVEGVSHFYSLMHLDRTCWIILWTYRRITLCDGI